MVEWLSKSHLNLRASMTRKTIKNANIIQTTNYKYKSMYYWLSVMVPPLHCHLSCCHHVVAHHVAIAWLNIMPQGATTHQITTYCTATTVLPCVVPWGAAACQITTALPHGVLPPVTPPPMVLPVVSSLYHCSHAAPCCTTATVLPCIMP